MVIPAFRGRALVASLMLCGFIALLTSGLALYASPAGRIARDLDWSFLALNKQKWRDLHLTFGLLFLIAAVFHIGLNAKPLVNYIRQKLITQKDRALSYRWRIEPALALLLCVAFAASSVSGLPPARYIADVREFIMQHWQSVAGGG